MRKQKRLRRSKGLENSSPTLASAPIGARVRIIDFGDLPPARLEHLQAYGLSRGRTVRIIQHAPVTIVRAEHTELAMEDEIAQAVKVEMVQ